MGDKKDPGKFTIRFNIADPQQQIAVELLNRQGRYKAQFITSAVLYYAHAASAAPAVSNSASQDNAAGAQHLRQESEVEREYIGSDKAADLPETGKGNDLDDVDMNAILKTMQAFQTA